MKAGGYGSPLSRGRHMGCPTPSMLSRPHITEQKSRDLALLDFLAAFGDAVAAVMAGEVFGRVLGRVDHTPKHLHLAGGGLPAQAGRPQISHRDPVGERVLAPCPRLLGL